MYLAISSIEWAITEAGIEVGVKVVAELAAFLGSRGQDSGPSDGGYSSDVGSITELPQKRSAFIDKKTRRISEYNNIYTRTRSLSEIFNRQKSAKVY